MPSSGVKTCALDRKSTRLNSSHTLISYAVFCLKKKSQSEITSQVIYHDLCHGCMVITLDLATSELFPTILSGAASKPTPCLSIHFFFFNDTAPTEISTLSLHDALPISAALRRVGGAHDADRLRVGDAGRVRAATRSEENTSELQSHSHLVSRLFVI